MSKVVVVYGNGDPKKGSVRMKPLSVEDEAVPVTNIGDYYLDRAILAKLGLRDSDSVKVTIEKA